MKLHTIGIDLGKTVFHLVGLNQCGEVVVRKKFSRKQLLHFTANLQVELIGMEALGLAHYVSGFTIKWLRQQPQTTVASDKIQTRGEGVLPVRSLSFPTMAIA